MLNRLFESRVGFYQGPIKYGPKRNAAIHPLVKEGEVTEGTPTQISASFNYVEVTAHPPGDKPATMTTYQKVFPEGEEPRLEIAQKDVELPIGQGVPVGNWVIMHSATGSQRRSLQR